MNAWAKWMAAGAVTVAAMAGAAHWTLVRGLNGEPMRKAVGEWSRRSTGWEAEYGKMGYGIWPARLVATGVRARKGKRWEAEAREAGVSWDWGKGEVREAWLDGLSVRMREDAGGAGNVDWARLPERVRAGWGQGFSVGRARVREGRFATVDASGKALRSVDAIEIETGPLGWDKPLGAEISFRVGGTANTVRVEANAGAPDEWSENWRDWPVRLRAEVLVNDLASAKAALGVEDTGPLERPAAWLNFVGTPGHGVTAGGAFTDGEPFRTPWITVNWNGELRAGADGRPEGELEVSVPLLKRGEETWRDGGGRLRLSGGRIEGRVSAGPWTWQRGGTPDGESAE